METSNTRDGPLNVDDIPTSKRVQYIQTIVAEFANEFQSKPTDDGIVKQRPLGNAAVLADIKSKFKE